MSYRRLVGPGSNTYAFDPPGKNEIRIWLSPVCWRDPDNGGFYITKKWGPGIPTTYYLQHVWYGDSAFPFMFDGFQEINLFTFNSLKNQAIKNFQSCKDKWTPQDEPDLKLLGLK